MDFPERRVARLTIKEYGITYTLWLPFGGYKQSGWGRESSALAVQNYLETKSVCMVI